MSELGLHASDPDVGAHEGSTDELGERSLKQGDVVAEKYLLVSYLARGGMAEVWLATHKELRTEVAVKFVHEHLNQNDENGLWALERFRFEAQVSARLATRTKHIVAVLDAGTHEGTPYLVMEYVPGSTLEADVEQNGPIDPDRMADLLDQVADALDAAHGLGIIHRDLKPSNFLIVDTSDEGGGMMVKVADFGVAKAMGTNLAVDKPRETQKGEVVGSPAFMSPEQLKGVGDLDPRSDIWSLGVVAYEMLTGQECFEGKTIMDTFASISMRKYRPPSTVRASLPRGIDAWLDKALAEDPASRYQSVSEMADAFRAVVHPRNPNRVPMLAGGLVALVAIAALLLLRLTASTAAARPVPSTSAQAPQPSAELAIAPPVQPVLSAVPSAAPTPVAPSPPTRSVVINPVASPHPTASAAVRSPPDSPPRVRKKVDPSEIQ
jgi:eukaryotic-like serine/threonine-protein kinase